MAEKVILTSNPQGVDIYTIGLEGELIKAFEKFALIRFTNEFNEQEEWYFDHAEYRKI
jgi:hypothetical protein